MEGVLLIRSVQVLEHNEIHIGINGLSGIFGYMENRRAYGFFEFWQLLHSLSNTAESSGFPSSNPNGNVNKAVTTEHILLHPEI